MATTTLSLIGKQTVGADGASSVTFSNIPQTYTDLKLVMSLRGDRANTTEEADISFNGSSSNFTAKVLGGSGSSAFSSSYTRGNVGDVDGANATSNTFGLIDVYIPNYTSSNYKSLSVDSVQENNNATAYAEMYATLWSNTAAITSLTITPNSAGQKWVQYSTFYLYGVSNSSTQNSNIPYASGGDIIYTSNGYWVHQFINSGTFTPKNNLTCDYLVVAGGGGGGFYGAGGGAGGYQTGSTSVTVSNNYAITVGSGGTKGSSTASNGTSGGNSSFGSIVTSTGGGYGSSSQYPSVGNGANGGSGGGAAPASGNNNASGTGGTGVSGQGYAGGAGWIGPTNNYSGFGGGGGASAVGGSSTSSASGAGGAGSASSISGTSVTYAGGGGGGGDTRGTTAGAAGSGGGGAGSTTAGANGSANLGGGGGGGGYNGSATAAGGNGGSGVVILRYAV